LITFEVVDPSAPQAVEALGHYFDELNMRFESGFDPETGGAEADRIAMSPPNGVFLVAVVDSVAIACGGVQCLDERTAEIKRMWVDPERRGIGLGRRLLKRLEEEAQQLGRTRVVLDTNSSLTEAIALYGRAGYRQIERYNDNPYAERFFEKEVS
jgi:GNAT superfamily N-acetyltransferase